MLIGCPTYCESGWLSDLRQASQWGSCLAQLVLELSEHGEGCTHGAVRIKYGSVRCQGIHGDGNGYPQRVKATHLIQMHWAGFV